MELDMAATKTAAPWNEVAKPTVIDEKQDSAERLDFYNSNAAVYDSDMKVYGYGILVMLYVDSGLDIVAETTHDLFKERLDSSILDVGSGTGLVAEKLLALGQYTNLEGLEPSEGMNKIAEEKKLYTNIMQRFLYLDCGLEHNTYDGVVTCGTFVAGHMKSEVLVEICNILKPGGYFIMAMRDEYLEIVEEYKLHLRSTINSLVKEGKWRTVRDEVFSNWVLHENNQGVDGHLFVFQKC
ncbi:WBSCR27 [Bugula neritina]|uniref:WBSCR27 n=1 Tax=Bugula neritina TaxID=10212 RepID=A0A7J7K4H4_BUGNE|nr:WBSCR27 [Bugula neritina]